jgi:hypothetical protein
MVVAILAGSAVSFTIKPASRCDVDLASYNGIQTTLLGFLVKVYCAMHHTVIGDGKGREVQFYRTVYQFVQPASSIKQGEFGVDM